MSIFSLDGLFGSILSGNGDNMPTPEQSNRVQNEIRLQNALASMSQEIDQRFKGMEMRIAELETIVRKLS